MDIFYLDWMKFKNNFTVSMVRNTGETGNIDSRINLSKKLLCHLLFDKNLFGNFDIKLNERFLRGVDVTSFLVFHTKATVNTGLKELVKL